MIIINFKNYKQGDEILRLAKLIEKHDVHNIVVVPAPYIERVSRKTALNVWAQHVDFVDERSTGFIGPSSVRAVGASGTLINHSEHEINLKEIKKSIEACRKSGIICAVCVSNLSDVPKIANMKPNAIAYEDKKLIATGKSITEYNPQSIEKFVSMLKNKPILPLCGAGISSIEDVDKAYSLGCKGVLISSAIAKNKNPEKLLKELEAWRF